MKSIRFNGVNREQHLRIRKRSFLAWAVFLVALWPFLIKLLSVLPGPLSYSKYIADGILLGIMVLAFCRSSIMIRRSMLVHVLVVCGLFVYLLLVYLFQYQSPFYFLWGFRNNFRFYIAFFAFAAFMVEADVKTWFKILDVLFWINIVLSVIQFLFLDVQGDFLGGIFGIEGASNGYTIVLFCVVIGKSLLASFSGQEKMLHTVLKSIASLLVAVMAEMKFYFIVFVLLLGMAAVFTRFSFRKLIFLMIGAVAIMWSSRLLVSLFEFQGTLSLEFFIDLATQESYSSQSDVNRLSAIASLSQSVITNPLDQIFGLGLGNCDTATFAICNTPFYQQYSHLHYTWFTAPMVFLEMGYIGLVLYSSFFLVCIWSAFREMKRKEGNQLYCRLTVMIAAMCILLVFYNSSLRIESAYMIYFVLVLPFIRSEQKKDIQTP